MAYTATSDDFVRVPITKTYDRMLDPVVLSVIENMVDTVPKEYDCCSSFEVCSDAGHCVRDDRSRSLQCGYRKILKSGRVFFGKNRNV